MLCNKHSPKSSLVLRTVQSWWSVAWPTRSHCSGMLLLFSAIYRPFLTFVRINRRVQILLYGVHDISKNRNVPNWTCKLCSWVVIPFSKLFVTQCFLKSSTEHPGAYLGFSQGGCTFLADLPPPPRIWIWIRIRIKIMRWIRTRIRLRIRIKTMRIHSPGPFIFALLNS